MRYIRLFVALFFLSNILAAQPLVVPENVYNLKNPAKEFDKRCSKCQTLIQNKPADVKFGTFAQDGYIYFILTDPTYLYRFFEKKNDGIAIDIIDRNWYVCGGKNKLANSWAYHGYLLKPMYLKEIEANLFQLETGSLVVKYAPVPAGLKEEDLEYNLLLIRDKYVCHYSNFYDVRGEKWNLLEMPLLMDSLTENNTKSKTAILNKEWRFEVPFEKNKSDFAPKDVKPIYDSLAGNDYYIKSIAIKAYSSVEGPTDLNIALQEKRAQSIIQALQSYQIETIAAQVQASENWVEFLEDISTTKYSSLKNLSKEEIKKALENKATSTELESILRKHRKAILHIRLEKKVTVSEEDTFKLRLLFGEYLERQNIKEALELQQQLFTKVNEQKLSITFVKELPIPEKAGFGLLLSNQAVFRYRQADADLRTTIQQMNRLQTLLPTNTRIRYNRCVLQLQAWAAGDTSTGAQALKNEISLLEKSTLDALLIKKLTINYHIIVSEYLQRERRYAEKDKAVRYIYNTYQTMNLADKDALSLSQYFVSYHKYDWAERLLAKYAIKLDVDEDLLFYYINLTIAQPKMTASKSYRAIMLNAINQNKERYCNLFKPFGKGGITFQLLDNDYLKKTYCENCR